MFKSMKPLTWQESRIANFPKAKTRKTVEFVDMFGKKVKYELLTINKSTNPFDGFGVVRSKFGKDGDCPFIVTDTIGLMSNWLTKNIDKVAVAPNVDKQFIRSDDDNDGDSLEDRIRRYLTVDMPDYVIMFDDWYAVYPDGHRRYVGPTEMKKQRLAGHDYWG